MKYGNRRDNKLDEAERQVIGVEYFEALNEKPKSVDTYDKPGALIEGRALTAYLNAGGELAPGEAAKRQTDYVEFWGSLPTFPPNHIHLPNGQLPRPAKNAQLQAVVKGFTYGYSNLTNPQQFGHLMSIRRDAKASSPAEMKAAWQAVTPQGRFQQLQAEMLRRVTEQGLHNVTDEEVRLFLEFWLWHMPVEGAAREKELQGRAQELLGPDWVVSAASEQMDEGDKVDLTVSKLLSTDPVGGLSVKKFDFHPCATGNGHPRTVAACKEELIVALGRWIGLKQKSTIKQTAFAWITPKGDLMRWSGQHDETPTAWKK